MSVFTIIHGATGAEFFQLCYVSNPPKADNINKAMLMPLSCEHVVGYAGERIHAYPAPVHTLCTMLPLCALGALPAVNDLRILPLIPLQTSLL